MPCKGRWKPCTPMGRIRILSHIIFYSKFWVWKASSHWYESYLVLSSGSIRHQADKIFDLMASGDLGVSPDPATYNVMIKNYCRVNQVDKVTFLTLHYF